MEYRNLGSSGLKVSEIGLGCNNFGWHTDEQLSISIVNHALDLGVNFFDTADLYSQGRSEEILGKALEGKRSQVLIATKFAIAVGSRPGLYVEKPNESGGSRYYIKKSD